MAEIFPNTALILCSHGVAGAPGAAAVHAESLRARNLFAQVAAACINGEPEIARLVDATDPAHRIVVVPFLMAAGRTFRTVLPERLATCQRRDDVLLAEPVGTHPDVALAIAALAVGAASERGWPVGETQIVIAAHGTTRDPESGAAARAQAARIAAARRFAGVEAGFLDEPPSIEGLLAGRAARYAIGVGLFADAGPHGAGDAAAPFAADPDACYAGPVGPEPGMAEIVLLRAEAALARL
jgi:sirohydrochlorin cobaltochelatase